MCKVEKKIKLMLVVFCVGFVGISSAQSQRDEKPKGPPTFEQLLEKMDENKDGKIEQSEVKGPLKDDFKTIDTNEDGFISEKELENAPKPKRRERREK